MVFGTVCTDEEIKSTVVVTIGKTVTAPENAAQSLR